MANSDRAELLTNEFPWLLFKLDGVEYAVYSKQIAAIVHLSDDLTVVPDEDIYIRGIMTFREKPIKIIDMRTLLSIKSIEKEYNEFREMIDERKQDHLDWVNELKRCIVNNEEFTLATDPHKCKLGKWLDSFSTDNNSVNYHINQVSDPHRELHETAQRVFECKQQHDTCKRTECLKTALERAEDELMPEVLGILEESKDVFRDIYKEMAIVFDCDDTFFAVLVDEVLAVDQLNFMDGAMKAGKMFATKYIFGVGKTQKSDKLVLLLDENKLATVCEDNEIESRAKAVKAERKAIHEAAKAKENAAKKKKTVTETVTEEKVEPVKKPVEKEIIVEEKAEVTKTETPKKSTKKSAKKAEVAKTVTEDKPVEEKSVPEKSVPEKSVPEKSVPEKSVEGKSETKKPKKSSVKKAKKANEK